MVTIIIVIAATIVLGSTLIITIVLGSTLIPGKLPKNSPKIFSTPKAVFLSSPLL